MSETVNSNTHTHSENLASQNASDKLELLAKQMPFSEETQKNRSVSGETENSEILESQNSAPQNSASETTQIRASSPQNTHNQVVAPTELATIDPELEQIKQRVREMEREAERLKVMQQNVEMDVMQSSGIGNLHHQKTGQHTQNTSQFGGHVVGGHVFPTLDEKIDADARSQVHYEIKAAELETHFRGCGAVNRVTVLCDKFTGNPKGFCYIEFADKDSVETAMALDGSELKGRILKVLPKRTNRPGISCTDRGRPRGRGRGRGGRGRGRGGYGGGYGGYGGHGGGGAMFRGRGRGRGAFSPY